MLIRLPAVPEPVPGSPRRTLPPATARGSLYRCCHPSGWCPNANIIGHTSTGAWTGSVYDATNDASSDASPRTSNATPTPATGHTPRHIRTEPDVSTVPWGSSETLPGSSEHSFRGTDSGDATTIDSEQHVAFATEQHSVAFFAAQGEPCAQCKTVIVLNSMLCSVGVGCTCAQASVGKACTGTQTTASTAALHVDKKGLVNVTSLGERSRATRVTSRLASHKISQATAALQFDLPVAHKSVQCIPRVKSKSTQFSTTGTRTSRTLQTRRAVNRPSSDLGNWHSKGAHGRQLSCLCFF
ncbi:uncharacterized protein LOC142590627 isoform X3 [Dermacentor variabilis]|uniref:uncharacterized protein LOC142590627 isoform X3 n=1 Tax=Dermacentor variabilis TaxID=34621 RepID=UPI003F5BA932